ncbi:uncharacterized protein LOC119614330, partial [Lucilia sericata]|uniref:uncharacterized protein LOC119614330 n=1 Tax=Lucilia sericata TaxID=13632 RepID=UPI0018A824E1
MTSLNTRFAFDAKNLISFCKKCDSQDILSQSEALIDLKLKDLDTRWSKVEKSYEDLMLSDQSEEVKTTAQEQYDSCVDMYYLTVSKLLDVIKTSRDSIARASIDSAPLNTSNDRLSTGLKLPPCDTQIFSGGYEDWPAFRDMFTAVYINHPRLTLAEKLYHLRNKTTGSAGAIVKRFPLTDNNFPLAWQALKLRYENVRVLVDNQIRNLFNIPVASVEDNESLQRIHSSVTDCLAMLDTMSISVEGWDPILVNLVYSKLPNETLAQWEQSLNASRELPTWSQLSDFLLKRCEVVERISTIKVNKSAFLNQNETHSQVQMYSSQEKLNYKCKMCDEDHSLRTCSQFRKLSIQERVDFIFKNKFCNNCLSQSHTKKNCMSKNSCLNCGKKHHTLLHMRSFNPPRNSSNQTCPNKNDQNIKSDPKTTNSRSVESNESENGPATSNAHKTFQVNANYAMSDTKVLLRTAMVQIESRGELFSIRALIDPGSERTFISEKVRNRLNIPSRKSYCEIIGVGGQTQVSEKECDLVLVSHKSKFRLPVTAIVLPKVTNKIPSVSFELPNPIELSGIDLADPNFNISSSIDLILGNDSERYINLDGIKRDVCGSASAYRTVFGWVLSGPVKTQPIYSFSTCVGSTEDFTLDELVRKFWEQEEIPSTRPASSEDEYCEKFYQQTTTRLPNGRYMVRLPFRQEFPESRFLSPSRFIALSQYVRMEQMLEKDPALSTQYNDVLIEYITLDHMEETTSREYFSENKCNSFYLPHHAVVRPESKSTKVRVVFNASRKTKSGFSLNDVLYTGPTLQADLMTVILNWRFYKFVFSGDIQKMYRQILVNPQDRPFQRILFQKSPREAIKDYQLKTVTFGINCAPFLAIRTLIQLASDSEDKFPKAADILRRETYVDDILTGGHSLEEVIKSQKELVQTLESAGFLLKKLTSNNSRLLASFPKEDLYDSDFLKFHDSSATKTLGIRWNALTDSFTYTFESIPQETKITKRKIVSSVAKLFDPAGWISPVVIKGKILIQQLWLERIASTTLPRLELSGAVMLAKLVQYTISSLNMKNHEIILWCDSSIVLGWLAKPPSTWKEIYVSNRVGQIHKLLPNAKWRHVPTHFNPADLGSRGCRPQDLINNQLWWQGPPWLTNPVSEWPQNNPLNTTKSPEISILKQTQTQSLTVPISSFQTTVSSVDILKRFSSYTRSLRVLAYVFRYIRRFKPSFANQTNNLADHNSQLSQQEVNS